MSCTTDYIEFVCSQLEGSGRVRSKKMFGEYMVYVNDKPLFLVCDNTVFIKQLPCVEELLVSAEKGHPYEGAKEHHILDVENRDLVARVVEALLPVVPVPKPCKKKSP